jgi:hypothetical protein
VGFFVGNNTVISYWNKYTSTDLGLTWTYATALVVTINGAATVLQPAQGKISKLRSGRWLGISGQSSTLSYVFYSDNEGTSWSHLATLGYWLGPVVEMYDGRLISVYEVQASSQIACRVSSDGGLTWGAAVTIASDAGSQNFPDIAQADNGDLVCVYESDEDSATNYEVKCKISSDYGATWGSNIDLMNYDASHKYFHPSIVKDINGTLIVACTNTTPNPAEITMSYSTDYGATWSAVSVIATSSDDPNVIGLSLVEGHIITCLYANAAADVYLVRAGYWEAYSDAAASYTYGGIEGQHLICGANVIWRGGNAVDGDIWTFDAAYDYAMSNVIEDSPSKSWRSTQDNVDCNIVFDLGSTERYFADGVAFFGCNVRTLKFQMNASDSWGSPSVDESISFDLTTGACDNNPAANEIQDTSLTAGYKDHELVGMMLRFTSGTLSGYTYEITDNVGSYILVNGDVSSATTNDTFAIYQDHVAATFTAGIYRYMRISISAQQTADNYYEIGNVIVGRTVTLSDAFEMEYELDHQYGISFLRTGSGGIVPIKDYGRKRSFRFGFPASDAGRKQAVALMDYIEGKNICLILDGSVMTNCYIVKMTDALTQKHVIGEYFSAVIQLEEVL